MMMDLGHLPNCRTGPRRLSDGREQHCETPCPSPTPLHHIPLPPHSTTSPSHAIPPHPPPTPLHHVPPPTPLHQVSLLPHSTCTPPLLQESTWKRALSTANSWNSSIASSTFLWPPGTRQTAPRISSTTESGGDTQQVEAWYTSTYHCM